MVATISTVSTVNPFAGIPAATFASVAGMTQVNNVTYPISATGGSSGAWTVTFSLINSTTFPAYSSGGTLTPSLYTGDILTVLGGTCTVQPQIEVADGFGHGCHSDLRRGDAGRLHRLPRSSGRDEWRNGLGRDGDAQLSGRGHQRHHRKRRHELRDDDHQCSGGVGHVGE